MKWNYHSVDLMMLRISRQKSVSVWSKKMMTCASSLVNDSSFGVCFLLLSKHVSVHTTLGFGLKLRNLHTIALTNSGLIQNKTKNLLLRLSSEIAFLPCLKQLACRQCFSLLARPHGQKYLFQQARIRSSLSKQKASLSTVRMSTVHCSHEFGLPSAALQHHLSLPPHGTIHPLSAASPSPSTKRAM